jgi:PIN domain nuclease of toxin-antitoxin system
MRLLLDTHAFIWWMEGNTRLSRSARSAIVSAENSIFVSAASAWEVSIKATLGKLAGSELVATDFSAHVASQGFVGLDITLDHAERAGSLPGPATDPFDRMLIAQSHAENLTIVSNEKSFDSYGITRLW